MLRATNDLEGFAIEATDGTLGHVRDFYFDDESWVVRYLIVDTGRWLQSRNVLISPISIGPPNHEGKTLSAALTMEQVRGSPDIDTEKPVSRQHELGYRSYYGYENYWDGVGLWEGVPFPNLMSKRSPAPALAGEPGGQDRPGARRPDDGECHLRSCKEVTGYHILATDGEIGHVHSMLIEEGSWAIRYVVVETGHWWLGHRVLIAPRWVRDFSWSGTTVTVELSRQEVKDAPTFDSPERLDRELEIGMHKHYQRPGYWEAESRRPGSGR
jgi:uncharacterized protein YrrD